MSDPPPECANLFVLSIRLAPERDKPLPQPGKQRTSCQRRDSSSRMLTSLFDAQTFSRKRFDPRK
jgi:hypothetical protein